MTAKTRAQLIDDAESELADNTSGAIDAEHVRQRVIDLADSMFNPLNDSIAAVPAYREVTDAGDVTVDGDDEIIGINKTVGAATNVNMGLAADRDGVPVVLKDIKGDANVNNITPVFSGGELCDGLTGAQVKIVNKNGARKFYPRTGGWYLL
jgi:hypothetical protein